MTDSHYQQCLTSPIGTLQICANEASITAILFEPQASFSEHKNTVTENACKQLAEYFSGTRKDFDLPLDAGGTEFQRTVWRQLQKIPYGEMCNYGDIANRIQNPKAVRAVGAANGRNPIPIIVPCHRVIGANGKLTGFAGGLSTKAWLLQHEGQADLLAD